MEGDFSRGHRPDAKRGRSYRRVLARQGAALLDSDLNALMDLGDRIDRQGITHLACAAGSTDLGFLVTPGRMLAIFDPELGQPFTPTAPATAVRDFSRKYLDRFPGLRINGGGGSVAVTLRAPLTAATACRVWLRADQPVSATIAGTVIALPGGGNFAPYPVTLNGATVTLLPGPQPYALALIETAAPVTGPAVLNWCAGEYQIGGLIAPATDAAWPDLSGPAGAAMLAASGGAVGARLVAYLELSERVVTAIEDPGLREQALGPGRETTSRSALLAQVKLATVSGLTDAAVAGAFARQVQPSGRVTFGTSAGADAADPCDLPVPGGYSGTENRLYRLQVHEASAAMTRFKWSRDNAAGLWPCTLMPDQPPGAMVTHVRVAASDPLRAGDLVELTSEAIERGDATPASLDAAGLHRPVRAQGRLFRLEGGEIVAGSQREFQLLDPATELPVSPFDPAPFGALGLKLRQWSGLLERPGNGAASLTLESGLIADVTGAFEPGDWWQAEARVLAPQANGPAVTTAHGPERQFAPLALLERGAANTPLILLAWLDTRSRKLCQQEADFTTYDGDRVGTDADTVQEALDELFLRLSDDCGEIAVPLGAPVQAVIDTIPAGGSARICLNAGTRTLTETIVVADKGDLIVGGIGPGTLLTGNLRRLIRFERCASVDLRDFALAAQGTGPGAVVDFVDCGEVRMDQIRITAAGPVPAGASAVRQVSGTARPTRGFAMRRCTLSLGMFDTGVTASDPGHAEIADNDIITRPEALNFPAALQAGGPVLQAAGAVMMDRLHFYDDDGGFDFVGGPSLDITLPGFTMARHGIALSNAMWGRDTLSFGTHVTLDAHLWEHISELNQPPGGSSEPPESMDDFLQGFRQRLVLTLFGLGGGAQIPADLLGNFNTVRSGLTASNQTIHGSAGIVVAASRGPKRAEPRNQPIAELLATPGQSARISGNRVSGFAQGVRVAASGNGSDRSNFLFFESVEVSENRISLRLPWQARQRGGIRIGHALGLRVIGNRVVDPFYVARSDGEPPIGLDSEGIRLWGWYGPMVETRGNFSHGVAVGIRWHPLGRTEPLWGRPDVFMRRFDANAYSGMGQSSEPAILP
ncbi:hypothetical protein [Paracoccus sp. PAR01]|uniref:hypothetical protein n=1 Tax=Paracoccus sp. PAR01 TaxID=2769282 RepID=UPI0017821230|nr:hypothetical protein [Paracoccus sp. PAR01]MBD9526976.1 hypothetical protein [Paracoccus sp. PAR01]